MLLIIFLHLHRIKRDMSISLKQNVFSAIHQGDCLRGKAVPVGFGCIQGVKGLQGCVLPIS